MYKLSIVICCYNKYNFTKSSLKDLFNLPKETHQIIIVDNNSSDETYNELSKIDNDNFIYIRNDENYFHSKGCNIGFAASSGENVMFLNNDIRVQGSHSNWTQDIIKHCSDGIIGPTMGQLDNKLNFIREVNQELPGYSYLAGWCITSSRENWNKLDLEKNGTIFNEVYPFYFNDTDLSFRCREQGISLKVMPVPITHFKQISAKQLNVQKLYTEARKLFIEDWKKLIK